MTGPTNPIRPHHTINHTHTVPNQLNMTIAIHGQQATTGNQ